MNGELKSRAEVLMSRVRFAAAGLAAEIREAATDRSPLAHDLSVIATELRKVSLLAEGIASDHKLEQ